MKTVTLLPNKLSALLRLAVGDAQKCEGDSNYVLDMGTWHNFKYGKCHVCLAGAVMAQTLEVPYREIDLPSFHQEEVQLHLVAIDTMRRGYFESAAAMLELSANLDFTEAKRLFKGSCGSKDWATYLLIADELEKLGV